MAAAVLAASARWRLRATSVGGGIGPGQRGHVGRSRCVHLQMVGAAIRGDDEVGVEVGGGRLDEDVDDSVLALAAQGVADDPAHGIAGGDGDELLAGLQARCR